MYFCLWRVLLNTVVPTGTDDRGKAPLCELVRGKNVVLLFWLAIQKVSNAGHCCSTFKVARKAEMESKDVMTSMLTHLFPECWHAIQKFLSVVRWKKAGCIQTTSIQTVWLWHYCIFCVSLSNVKLKHRMLHFGLSLKIDLYNGCYGRHAHRQ